MKVSSIAYEEGQPIPAQYTCDGANETIPLEISEVPIETKSLTIIFDDPDAPMGLFTHWLVFNISPLTRQINHQTKLDANFGVNDFEQVAYGGPCPPDKEHRYYMKIFALDTKIDLDDGVSRQEIEKAMEGHIIDQATLMGTYNRQQNIK